VNRAIKRGLLGGLAVGLLGVGLIANEAGPATSGEGGANGRAVHNQSGQLVAPGSVVAQLRRDGDKCVADEKVGVTTKNMPGEGTQVDMAVDPNTCRLVVTNVSPLMKPPTRQPNSDGTTVRGGQ
jgi:hypothetical protein